MRNKRFAWKGLRLFIETEDGLEHANGVDYWFTYKTLDFSILVFLVVMIILIASCFK